MLYFLKEMKYNGVILYPRSAEERKSAVKNPSRILIDGSKFGLDWLQIYWYGALIVTGIILSYILCSVEAKRRRFHKDCVIDLCLIIIPLGAIFARLYYVLFELETFIRPGMSLGQILLGIINVRDGGLAIYGAIIGGVIGMIIYGLAKKMHIFSITDLIMPSVALSQAIGRWGNYFNQEAYGGLVAKNFPHYFPLAVKIDECHQSCCANLASNAGNIHYATFFYESCWCLIIFGVLWFILRKRVKHRGDITLAYLIMYGVERALLESMRTDSLWWGRFRVSQVLSAALVAISVLFIIIRTIAEKKKGRILMPVENVYYGVFPDDKAKKKDGWETVPPSAEAAANAEEAAEEAAETAEEAAEEAVEEGVEEAAEEAVEAAADAADAPEVSE